jgi:phosphopantetheinyl transferase
MPIFKEWSPDENSVAAIWHITELESFFTHRINLGIIPIKHPKRRIEFLVGRYLLQYLKKDFPIHDILVDENGKPKLLNDELFFSISHSFPYVACVLNVKTAVGIDIQCWHDNILAIQKKFLSSDEQFFCENDPKKITLAWTAKESAYKFQGAKGVDFIQHLPIVYWEEIEQQYNITINLSLFNPNQKVFINSTIMHDFAFSVTTKK